MRELRKTYLEEKRKAIEAREEVIQKIEKRERDGKDFQLEKNQDNDKDLVQTQDIVTSNYDANI